MTGESSSENVEFFEQQFLNNLLVTSTTVLTSEVSGYVWILVNQIHRKIAGFSRFGRPKVVAGKLA